MSEIEKCPMCDSDLILSGTAQLYYCCTRCMLRCDRKDLPRVAAAMDLANSLSSLDKCDAKTQHLWEQHVDMAEKRVLEVFNEQATEADKSKNIMVYLNGKDKPAFRCHCGCNIFHHPTDTPEEKSQQTYICNACDTQYRRIMWQQSMTPYS